MGYNEDKSMEEEEKRNVAYFARTNFRNKDQLFGIKRKDRRQHMYVIGQSGTGKSSLLHNLVIQDIANGEGLCVVDPHGELVEGVLSMIPEERIKDVVYFNPADTDYPIGFNILELPDPKYKHLVASGLMGIFTKIWSGVWSARMEYIMNNAILALLDTPGTTLLGITRILVDKDYRQKIIANVKDPVVKAFWINEFEEWKDQFRNEAIAPIQNKVGQFLSTPIVRNIVGQPKSTINILDIMNSGKIFLVNVSKGRIGEDNSALLGAMLITKIQLAAMERVRIPEEERVDFYLHVDEFQNFATDSFANILSEARKYRLNLILAHQYIGQLTSDGSTIVRDAVFGNVGTMLMFRVGAADGEFLAKEFEPEFTPTDMVNLPNFNVYLKLLVDGYKSRPFSAQTLPPFKLKSSNEVEQAVITNSRKIYTKQVWSVEREIMSWSGVGGGDDGNDIPKGENEVNCMICGKHVKLPFTPIPGRPVYCPECYGKVKAGELEPIRVMPQNLVRERVPQPKQTEDLAKLGIEFEYKKSPVSAEHKSQEANENLHIDQNEVRQIHKPSDARSFRRPTENTKPRFEKREATNTKPAEHSLQHTSKIGSIKRSSIFDESKFQNSEEKIEEKQKDVLSLSSLKSEATEAQTEEVTSGLHMSDLRSALSDALKKLEKE
jgi:CxxC-x17-CxxC domain-containing protein